MSGFAGFSRVGVIGKAQGKAALLAGVSILALSLPALAAPLVYDADTTINSADNSAENVWVGFNNPNVTLDIDATGGPASLTISSGNSFYLGVSAASDNSAATLTGSLGNTAGIISGDQVFVGQDSDDNTLTLNAFSLVSGTSLVLGVDAASDGNLVELTTATSSIELTSNLIVGFGGSDNDVTLDNGAGIEFAGVVILGNNAGSTGNSITLSNGSSITGTGVASDTTVGLADDGNSILVQSGADYTTHTTTIGSASGADNNSVTVTGAGSTYTGTTNGSFNVGGIGDGNTLMVSDGAVVTIGDRLAIGQNVASTGNTATITGAGAEFHAGNVRVGAVGSSDNSLVIADGGYLDITGDMKVRGGNSISLASGAVVDVNGAGGFTTDAGSTIVLDVDAANAIDFDVTNAALLDGTLEANYSGGTITNSYLVLSSGALTNNLTLDASGFAPGFTVSLDEDGNALYLVITADLGGSADLGDNQQNVADALNDAFADGGVLSDALVDLFGVADADLDEALAGATGEINAYAMTEMGWFGTEAAVGLLTGPELCTPGEAGQFCVHAFASGDVSAMIGNDEQGSHHTTSTGVTLGVAAASRVTDGTVIRGLVTIDQSHAEVEELGTADVTSLRFGSSVKQDWSGFYASFGVAGGVGMGSSERSFSSFTPGSASAEFSQAYLGVRGEVGTDVSLSDNAKLTPFAAIDWANTGTSAYAETATGDFADLALEYDNSDYARTSADLGLRLATLPTDAGLILAGAVAYRRVLVADDAVETQFQSLADTTFEVTPATAPLDTVRLSADLTLPVTDAAAITAKVDAGFGAGYQSASGKVGLFGQW